MKLGMKRADTVKAALINAGVAEHQIKTMSLGKEGVLCIDMTDVCRQMNRRVHLEIRPIGEEHMRIPIVATTPAPDSTQASSDPAENAQADGSLIDSLVSPANAAEGDNGTLATEPASGS